MELYIHIDNLLIQTGDTDLRQQGELSRGEIKPYKYTSAADVYSDLSKEGIAKNWHHGPYPHHRTFTEKFKNLAEHQLSSKCQIILLSYYSTRLASHALLSFFPTLSIVLGKAYPEGMKDYRRTMEFLDFDTDLSEYPVVDIVATKYLLQLKDGTDTDITQYLDFFSKAPKAQRFLLTNDKYLLGSKKLRSRVTLLDATIQVDIDYFMELLKSLDSGTREE